MTGERCDGITGSGRQCRRRPNAGSAYCAQHIDNPCTADFSAMFERAVNGLAVVMAAKTSGNWTPSARSEMLLRQAQRLLQQRK